jgi:ABC-2 type transport system ATP-binding protein
LIAIKNLTKTFGPRIVLRGLNLIISEGDFVTLLGANGAGKTTTMRILTGYMPPTEGEATVAGYDIVSESIEVRRRVGYLPETVPLYTDMTVFDYLKFMADLRHLPGAEDRVDETLELVGMEDRAEGYIGNLSKGMRQRVGLAQALLHRPEVLILDEPTIGLDPGQVVEVRNVIREIGKERTVLLSTHILSEAQQLCDRVLIINKGRIVAEDTPANLQASLVGAERNLLRVRGEAEELEEKLLAVKGVSKVQRKEDGLFEFHFAPGQDVRPEVAKLVVNAGYDLLEMRPIGMSLEEIFLQLTREETNETEM